MTGGRFVTGQCNVTEVGESGDNVSAPFDRVRFDKGSAASSAATIAI